MERTYLFVPPEEKSEAEALGARWDDETKRWYIDSAPSLAKWAKWLPNEDDAERPQCEEFEIISDHAFVAAALVACQACGSHIEVICIYCESGTVSGEPIDGITVSHVSQMDEGLARQIEAWPHFRRQGRGSYFNWCPRCNARQDDLYLHSEPGDAFFDIVGAPKGAITVTALAGTIRLNGDEHFRVDD
jgi:hypothetical protein